MVLLGIKIKLTASTVVPGPLLYILVGFVFAKAIQEKP